MMIRSASVSPSASRWPGRRPAWLALSLAVLGTSLSCAPAPTDEEPVVTVQVAKAARQPMTEIVSVDAVLYPLAQAAIVPKISAPVEHFAVNRGDRVRKDQVLAVLEHRDLAAAAAQADGQYQQAQAAYQTALQANVPADVQKAELDVTTSKEALDAQQKVYDDRKMLVAQGALPQRDLDTASVALAQAKSAYEVALQHQQAMQAVTREQSLKAAAAELASAKAQYEAAEAQLSYATIVSPIDGFVTDRPFYAGEMATAGTPLLTVMETSAVVARAPVPEEQAAQIKLGAPATITVPGIDDPVTGKVTVVSPALDPSSTTVQVWVQASNPKGRLKPGTSVQVGITARTAPDAIVVPAVALVATDSGQSVMVVGSDGKAHARSVEIGIRQGDLVQITKGLSAGETVVTTGAYGLPDDTKVQVQAASGGSGRPQE
jgi:HlyD family secretion protein